MDDFQYAKREAMIAGALVALISALLALWTSGLLVVFGIVTMLLGLVVSLTVIGALIGIPLIVVGFLGLLAGVVSGAGGVPFAVLFGAGVGYIYYRYRMRALGRDTEAHSRHRVV
jgi:hypothetical protein